MGGGGASRRKRKQTGEVGNGARLEVHSSVLFSIINAPVCLVRRTLHKLKKIYRPMQTCFVYTEIIICGSTPTSVGILVGVHRTKVEHITKPSRVHTSL